MTTRAILYSGELLETLDAEFRRAADFSVGVALLTMSGVPLLLEGMRTCLGRGGKGDILVGVDLPTHPDALAELLKLQGQFPTRLSVKRFKSPASKWFHPKIYLFTPRKSEACALVGSSNMTAGGLKNNYEASVWLDDPVPLGRLREYFHELHNGGHAVPVNPSWLARYRRVWNRRQKVQKADGAIREQVREIRETGRNTEVPKQIRGNKFVFTGGIEGWPRERKLYPRVRKLGGTVGLKASALPSASCLVHGSLLGGSEATLKLTVAKKLGVPIISDEEFLPMLTP